MSASRSISPFTEQPIAHVPAGTSSDIDRAVLAARDAFDNGEWSRLTVGERIEVIERLATIYAEHVDEMADLITAADGFTGEL